MEDVFAIQDEIARAVVEALKVELLGEPGAPLVTALTDDLEAYELYLKGRHYWSRRYEYGLQTAIQFFEEASEKDPDFALPYTGIADTHAVLGLYAFVPPLEARERAGTALEKATALGPDLPEVLYSRGFVRMVFGGPLDEVERTFARGLELDPNQGLARAWRGLTLIDQGLWEQGLEEAREAAEREPYSAYLQGVASLAFLWVRNAPGGIPFAERALALEPDGVLGLYSLGYLYSQVGRHEEAVDLLTRCVETTGGHHNFLSWKTSVLAPAGRLEEVESIRKKLLAMYDPAEPKGIAYSIGTVYVSLGDGENAVEWLKKGIEEGFPARNHVVFPQYDAIRGHPGFAAIIEGLGLPPLWADPSLGR
jgi:serine/threonine-protein kinase